MVNAYYIIQTLTRILRVFKQKRPAMVARDLWFHWDDVPVHTAPVVTYKMAVRQFRIIEHQETLTKEWERAVRTLSTSNFAMAFRQL